MNPMDSSLLQFWHSLVWTYWPFAVLVHGHAWYTLHHVVSATFLSLVSMFKHLLPHVVKMELHRKFLELA